MSRDLSFEEIALRIQRSEPDGYFTVQVTSSPYGSAAKNTVDFTPVFRPNENLREPPQATGDRLFRTLFSGRVLEVFHQCMGRVESTAETGLRIRLRLDPALPEISALPWELLYRADTRDFLARSHRTPLVRDLDVSRLTEPSPLESPLRILVIRSDPSDQDYRPDLDGERERLVAAWGGHEGTVIDFLEPPTLLALRRKLISESFHVLHFMGHGGFDAESGGGVLLFEDTEGLSAPVWGRVLAEAFKDCRSLRLICLNACDTARLPQGSCQDAFSGVASALILAGLPAVVAMQRPISERAARVFSQYFYTALAAGFPVDAATAEARRAIHLECDDSSEWAIPALFMSASDGRILLPEPDKDPPFLISLREFDKLNLVEKRALLTDSEGRARDFPEASELHFALGLRYLGLRCYEQALSSLKEATRKGCREAGLDFCIALATLGGQQPRTLTLPRINEVERHLEAALQADCDRPEAFVLSAIIKEDFYHSKGLRIKKPSIDDLLLAAFRCNSVQSTLQVLANHMTIPVRVRERLSA